MQVNQRGIDLIRSFEGCRLKAYGCPAGVCTIGWGSTRYADGSQVKWGDTITKEEADELFYMTLEKHYAEPVRRLLRQELNDNQFSALVSLAYNIGVVAFSKSTLLRKVNANPSDQSIRDDFAKWRMAGGKVLQGLVRRRAAEADLYFIE